MGGKGRAGRAGRADLVPVGDSVRHVVEEHDHHQPGDEMLRDALPSRFAAVMVVLGRGAESLDAASCCWEGGRRRGSKSTSRDLSL